MLLTHLAASDAAAAAAALLFFDQGGGSPATRIGVSSLRVNGMLDFTLDGEEVCVSTRAAEVGRGTAGRPATGEDPGCFS